MGILRPHTGAIGCIGLSVFNVCMDHNYYADIYYCIYTDVYQTFTLILIKKNHRNKSEKHFEKV